MREIANIKSSKTIKGVIPLTEGGKAGKVREITKTELLDILDHAKYDGVLSNNENPILKEDASLLYLESAYRVLAYLKNNNFKIVKVGENHIADTSVMVGHV